VSTGDIEPGAHRREIATSRHVPIRALDRVEQVGNRHSVLDRRPVEGRHPRLAHRVGVQTGLWARIASMPWFPILLVAHIGLALSLLLPSLVLPFLLRGGSADGNQRPGPLATP